MRLDTLEISLQGRYSVTMNEASEILGISSFTLRRIIRNGGTCLHALRKPTPAGRFYGVTTESLLQHLERMEGRDNA